METNKAIILLIVLLVLSVTKNVPAEPVNVITDIGFLAGERGTALTLSVEGSPVISITGKGKEVVIYARKCIYGIGELSYQKYPVTSPIKAMEAIEIRGGDVEIHITMKNDVALPIKTVQKKSQYMALLSQKPEQQFTWNTVKTAKNERPIENAVVLKTDEDTLPASLNNIRLLERGQVSELVFEFDKKAKGTIHRKKETIELSIDNAINKIGRNEIKIPAQGAFDKITIYENAVAGRSMLRLVFKIDSHKTDTSLNIAFTQGEVISVYFMKREHEKATLWTSGHGLKLDYKFYNVPSYNVDMQTIGKRAESDAKKRVDKNNLFAIKEIVIDKIQNDIVKKDEVVNRKTENTQTKEIKSKAVVQNDRVIDISPITLSTDLATKVLVTTSGVVNVRRSPSINGVIAAKVKHGDTLTLLSEKVRWVRVTSGGDTGFIYKSLVQKIKGTVKSDIALKEGVAEIKPPGVSDAPANIQPVSTTPVETVPMTESESTIYTQALELNNLKKEIPEIRKKVVQYHGKGRDPFMPIGADSVGISEYPFVDNLNLVGVLIDDKDRIALCEDSKNDNRPFTLREQDQVFKGKVLKIYKDKVIFLLTEYGISRSFTLSLTNKKNILEASKK